MVGQPIMGSSRNRSSFHPARSKERSSNRPEPWLGRRSQDEQTDQLWHWHPPHTTSDQWSNWWASVGQASVLIKLVLGKHGYNWASQVGEASQVWGGKSLRNPHICAREVSLECYPCNLFLDICSHSTHELYFLDTWNWRPKNSLKW